MTDVLDLEKQICAILKKRFRCWCANKPPYCSSVVDVVNLILEKCEEEVSS